MYMGFYHFFSHPFGDIVFLDGPEVSKIAQERYFGAMYPP